MKVDIKLGEASCMYYDYQQECKGCPLKAWDICLMHTNFKDIKETLNKLDMEKKVKVEE